MLADKEGISPEMLLKNAGDLVHNYTDIYENPKTSQDYSKQVEVEFGVSEVEYRRIADRANRYGITLEMILLEAVRLYDLVNA